jgi:hypothetical protein
MNQSQRRAYELSKSLLATVLAKLEKNVKDEKAEILAYRLRKLSELEEEVNE